MAASLPATATRSTGASRPKRRSGIPRQPLLCGRQELDAVRDARPEDGPRPSRLEATEPVIDVFDDVALVRHVLVVGFSAESDLKAQRIRNTSVWRKTEGGWLCVHNHEDVVS